MINVLVSVNESYLPHLRVMIHSLSKNTNDSVIVYLLNHELTHEQCIRLANQLKNCSNVVLKVVDVSNTELDRLPVCPGRFSIEMYYRIIAQYVLPPDIDRILWLDSDIVILNNIDSFYRQDFENMCLVACPDRATNSDSVKIIKRKLGMNPNELYFNSGVLLLNLKKLRREYSYSEILKRINKIQDQLTYPDQDILNYLYSKTVKYCDWMLYNYQVDLDSFIPNKNLKQIHIMHFTGNRKPWKFQYYNSLSKYYWNFACEIGYKNDAFLFRIKGLLFWPFARIRDLRMVVVKHIKIFHLLGDC